MTAPEKDLPKNAKKAEPEIVQAAHEAGRSEAAPAPVRRYRALAFQGILILGVVIFGALAFFASTTAYFPVDLQVTLALQTIRSAPFSGAMSLISWLGYSPQSYLVTVVIVGLIYAFGFRWEAVSAAAAAAFSEGLNNLVKILVHRPRPASDLVNVVAQLNSFSFPSGHVMYYTSFLGFLWFLAYITLKNSWKRTLLLVILGVEIALVGVSRVYLGAHWFSDVVGAYLLGSIILVLVIFIYRWGKPRFFVRQPTAREPKKAESK